MEIDIEVFYHSEETLAAKRSDEAYSVVECDTRVMTFYNISAITPYFDEGVAQWFCEIYIGDRSFIALQDYEAIKKLIHDNRR